MQLKDAITMQPDYVVVGGGPAGCVLASRLSEDPAIRVLLLEAGGSSDGLKVRIPAGVGMLVGNDRYDWNWDTPPDPTIGGRRFTWSAGKCLGGGSAINGQVNIRCLPSDFDLWADVVDQDGAWSAADLQPYFVRCESYHGVEGPSPARGTSGPQAVSDIPDPHPLAAAFLAAGEALGAPRVDLNGATPEGFGMTQGSQRDGRRFTAYDGYLRPHVGRPNLAIVTDARVTRIVVEDGRATGVEVRQGTTTRTVSARREVLVSAGTVATTNLLLKSGIGPADVLDRAGVATVAERRGVGANLQEHTGVSISRFIRGHWSLNSTRLPHKGLAAVFEVLARRRGPLASPVVQAMGYVRTDPSLDRPDLQLHFLPFAYRLKPDSRSALTAEMPLKAAVAMQLTLCKPQTRGRITITDADPLSAPTIDHQLLDDERDLRTMVAGCRLLEELFEHPAFGDAISGRFNPPAPIEDDAGWEAFVRRNCCVAYHQTGTCRMGRADDPDAVVDADLRVIGVRGLRVVDASVMPVVPSANTYVPTLAVAEKASDLIRAAAVPEAPTTAATSVGR